MKSEYYTLSADACPYTVLYAYMCSTSQEVAVNVESSVSSSRVRLEELKTRAKRSLTESLEGIWKVCKYFMHF